MKNNELRASQNRRGFIKLCMGAFTVGGLGKALANGKSVKEYNRVALTDSKLAPVLQQGLQTQRAYVFHYPYVSTPCFLIDLDEPVIADISLTTENGEPYTWGGGVGPKKSIVAFSAICAHKMTHPAKSVSFINFRSEAINYQDKENKQKKGENLIYCCSERSVYDVKEGARVLGGPAPQPLTAIVLEYDRTSGHLYAVGTSGGEMYEKFFREFTPRLQLEYLITKVDTLAAETTEVSTIEEFSKTRMTC